MAKLYSALHENRRQAQGKERLMTFLQALKVPWRRLSDWHGVLQGGVMGGEILSSAGVSAQVIGAPAAPTSAQDTRLAVKALGATNIDLLLFVGGDGTAIDVLAAVDEFTYTCVLGLPAGVKMHSGVFAISPTAAADVVAGLAQGSLVDRIPREVRD